MSGCQGQADACEPGQLWDVLSGVCKDGGDGCTLGGPSTSCGEAECGPGSACSAGGPALTAAATPPGPVEGNGEALQSWPLPSAL